MARRTLIDFFEDLSAAPGDFLVHDDGYRSWSFGYAATAAAAAEFAARLRDAGVSRGQTVILWGENRAEWIFALWGALLEGIVVVPIDYRASADFLLRVATIVDARLVVAGDLVAADALGTERRVWMLSTLRELAARPPGAGGADARVEHRPQDTAEIIF